MKIVQVTNFFILTNHFALTFNATDKTRIRKDETSLLTL